MKGLYVCLILILCKSLVFSQCKSATVNYNCECSSNKAIYIRDFNTKLKKNINDSIETGRKWTIVLNKGTHYRFCLCYVEEEFKNQVVMTLYDSLHPEYEKPYGCTYNPTNNKDQKDFDFICSKSGMYDVSIRFKKGMGTKKSCAIGLLLFVGKNK